MVTQTSTYSCPRHKASLQLNKIFRKLKNMNPNSPKWVITWKKFEDTITMAGGDRNQAEFIFQSLIN